MNKKIITGISVFAAVIVFAAVSTATRHIHRPGPETVEEKPVCLNDTLTNGMSDIDTLKAMDAYIEKFLKQWEIKGASLSVMRNDSLVYSKGYGWADQEAGEPMTPGKILRMASVSKLITATGIMMLKERGLLTLQDKVFGPDGILNDSLFTASIRYKTMYSITVEQLLRHQGGFTNSRGDPMFSTRDIIRQFRLDGPPDHNTLVSCVLKRPLGYRPGSWQRYSNFGYLVLGRVIEKVSGMPYEKFIRRRILRPCGIRRMRIGEPHGGRPRRDEPRYYLLPEEIGGTYYLDVRRMDAHGGWIASAEDMARFMMRIDRNTAVGDILPDSLATQFYLGFEQWIHTGSLPGTAAVLMRIDDRLSFVLLADKRSYDTNFWEELSHETAAAIALDDKRQREHAH